MNKTSEFDLFRLFLIDDLPEPLSRSSSHLQIFDNYIAETRLRLRKMRDPYTGVWTRSMQQISITERDGRHVRRIAEIHLNDAEYNALQLFERNEIRKNRYFHEFDNVNFAFDVYLGDLSGLTMARVEFNSIEEMNRFEPPVFAVFEVTDDPFFGGAELVGKHYENVKAEVDRLGSGLPRMIDLSDE